MRVYEVPADGPVTEKLIAFSKDWAAENSCYGYRANEPFDIEGNRVFFAEEDGSVIGYKYFDFSKTHGRTNLKCEVVLEAPQYLFLLP